jgi:hypothetical protein
MIDLLMDVDGLHAASVAERRGATAELSSRLGGDWRAEEPSLAEDALALLHLPTSVRFVAVPGGSFDMGLTDADLAEAAEHLDWTSWIAAAAAGFAKLARPVRRVEVRPFLASRTLLLDVPLIERLTGGTIAYDSVSREEARTLARAAGFRLPSEAELEWLARDGGRCHFTLDVAAERKPVSRFGVQQIFWGEWAEDDWHAGYDGAPSDSKPWYDGEARGVYRHAGGPEQMQSRDELLFMLAGVRGDGAELPDFTGTRFALDLP